MLEQSFTTLWMNLQPSPECWHSHCHWVIPSECWKWDMRYSMPPHNWKSWKSNVCVHQCNKTGLNYMFLGSADIKHIAQNGSLDARAGQSPSFVLSLANFPIYFYSGFFNCHTLQCFCFLAMFFGSMHNELKMTKLKHKKHFLWCPQFAHFCG